MNKNKWQAVAYFILGMSPFLLMIAVLIGLAVYHGVLVETLVVAMCVIGLPVFYFGIPFILDKLLSASIWSLNRSIVLWKKDESNE